jgi:hypothetical protein
MCIGSGAFGILVFYVLGVFARTPINGVGCLYTLYFFQFYFHLFLYSFHLFRVSDLPTLNLCYSNRVCLNNGITGLISKCLLFRFTVPIP